MKFICNKTNARAISAALGSGDTDSWIGQQIKLFTMPIDFRGELVDAVRDKPAPKAAATTRLPTATTCGSDGESHV